MEDFLRIRIVVRGLALEPRPYGAKKLKGRENTYRLRVGKYRILYEIIDKTSTVVVIEIVRRSDNTYS